MHLVFKLFSFTNCHGNVLTVIECDKEKTVIALVYSIEVDNLAVVDSKEKWVVEHVLYPLRFFEMVIPLPEFRNTVE